MLNEERCLLNYRISLEWIPKPRSVPLIAAIHTMPASQRLNYSSTIRIHPLRLLLFSQQQPTIVALFRFGFLLISSLSFQRTATHSNHSSSSQSSSLFVAAAQRPSSILQLLLYSSCPDHSSTSVAWVECISACCSC